MRGYMLALAHSSRNNDKQCYRIQILDYTAGKQSHVARGVWSAELYNQCDALAKATVLLGFLEEVRRGPQRASVLCELQDRGAYSMPLEMFPDSFSVWSYLDAQHLEMPAEKNTLYHLAFCLEALQTGLVHSWHWVDTRDMCVDGLTKGKADRSALHQLMGGLWKLQYDMKTISDRRWPSKTITPTSPITPTTRVERTT